MSDIAQNIKDREQAFEAQYKLDEEQNFKIRARRDRMFGQWVAKNLGLSGEESEAYALRITTLDLEKAGDQNLLEKVKSDLNEAGKTITDDALQAALIDCQSDSQKSFLDEYPEALDSDHHL